MSAPDLFGQEAAAKRVAAQIGNQRPKVAEEKATLLLILGRYINRVPASVRGGSVQLTRQWMFDRTAAAKTARDTRSSVTDISSAINMMRKYGEPDE